MIDRSYISGILNRMQIRCGEISTRLRSIVEPIAVEEKSIRLTIWVFPLPFHATVNYCALIEGLVSFKLQNNSTQM